MTMLTGANIASVEPFRGVVNIRFRGAVIASSEAALVARNDEGRSLHLVPFRGVNFELLAESRRPVPNGGLSYWDVVAEGERVEAAVVVFEKASEDGRIPVAHAAFLSDEFDADIITAEEKARRVADWPS
jgi:uncharacterized protein (DUF427 family)